MSIILDRVEQINMDKFHIDYSKKYIPIPIPEGITILPSQLEERSDFGPISLIQSIL